MRGHHLLLILSLLTLITLGDIDCITQPWEVQCRNFKIPDSQLNMNNKMLCGMMYMPGCSLLEICNNTKEAREYPQFCTPFAVFKTLCTDMPGMGSCKSFKSMCLNASSVVEQCKTEVIPLPNTGDLAHDISAICASMNMPGCEKCNEQGTKCDGLIVYSGLCQAMPSMTECAAWDKMCKFVPKWSVCGGGDGPVTPSMIMYFHFGIHEYILFQDWVPQTEGQFILAVVIIFISSILYELLKFFRFKMERGLKEKQAEDKRKLINHGHHHGEEKRQWNCSTSALRAFWHLVEVLFGAVLMLLLMTFNVVIFLSIIVGRAVGAFIVGNRMDYGSFPGQNDTAECH